MKTIDEFTNKVINAECLQVMAEIPDKSVDMILCDLPYGVLSKKMLVWDSVIPLEPLWEAYKRIIRPRGAIVLTATQPFASALIMSNPEWFKFEFIWSKPRGTGFQIAKYRPLVSHEQVLIFGKGAVTYNPQMRPREKPRVMKNSGSTNQMLVSNGNAYQGEKALTERYPITVLEFSNENQKEKIHPTQKPVALFEYMIKTFSNEGETVLDNCAGSFTTAIAAINTNRNWICIEQDETYCKFGGERISNHLSTKE